MNVATHQEKEKTDNRKVGKERRQSTDFKEAACCRSAVVQGAARRKNGLCEGSTQNNCLGKANRHFDPTQMGSGTAPQR